MKSDLFMKLEDTKHNEKYTRKLKFEFIIMHFVDLC